MKKKVLLAIVALSLATHWTVLFIALNSNNGQLWPLGATLYFGSLIVGFTAALSLHAIAYRERFGVPLLVALRRGY